MRRRFIWDDAAGRLVEASPERAFAPRVHIQGDYRPYRCPVSDRVIEGRRAHRDNLARHDCRLLERGEREAAQRERERVDALPIDPAIDRMIPFD